MTKNLLIVLLLTGLGYVAAAGIPERGASAPAALERSEWFTVRGKATRVVDGDTIHVRVGKRIERVRLIGIDAPEIGDCSSAEATAEVRRLVLNKPVVLVGDRTQTRRDAYRRLLAYLNRGGVDVGRHLLERGYALLYETERPFARQRLYETAASVAASASAGLHGACAAPATTTAAPPPPPPPPPMPAPPPPVANCAPSYPDVCIAPPPPDLDCKDVPHRRFRVVHTVPNADPHRFDGDRDGIGCES